MTDTHNVNLEHGFIDSTGKTHNVVIFGHRPNGSDLINVDRITDYMGQSFAKPLYLINAIIGFGSLPSDKFLDAVLSLDALEYEQVIEGFNDFLGLQESKPQPLSEDSLRLAYGVEIGGVRYDVVTFGNLLRGWDLIKAEKLTLTDVERACYLIGLQVSKLSTSDGQHELAGTLALESFHDMDAEDITALKQAADVWKQARRRALKRDHAEAEGGASSEAVN